MKKISIQLIFYSILIVCGPATSLAGTYWISPQGTETWLNCQSPNPLEGTAACSLKTANENAVAGDTLNLREGTYNMQIKPSGSGNDSKMRIIYKAYNGEKIIITQVSDIIYKNVGIDLDGIDYIKIDGVTVHTVDYLAQLRDSSDYNEITNCTLYNAVSSSHGNNGVTINNNSTHNWIHNCTIYQAGGIDSACQDKGYTMKIGTNKIFNCNYNTIEDNKIYQGGHHVLEINAQYIVVRNNFMHNQSWLADPGICSYCADTNGKFGNRVLMFKNGSENGMSAFSLIENNRIGDSGLPVDGNGANGIVLGSKNLISRYNTIYNIQETGMYFRSSTGDAIEIHAYNNTIYKAGQGQACRTGGFYRAGIRINSVGAKNNVIKNNLVYQSNTHHGDIVLNSIKAPGTIVSNNWVTTDGDPRFVDTTFANSPNRTTPDLSLQNDSPCIDGGTYLTQTNAAGNNSYTVKVDDAWYFQDGTWGSSLVSIDADWIAVGTVDNVVQISSINYASNTITLATPITWGENDSVWLYKDSNGNRVLFGSAPDQGARELGTLKRQQITDSQITEPQITEPQNPRIKSIN